jgi:hypothetical protein
MRLQWDVFSLAQGPLHIFLSQELSSHQLVLTNYFNFNVIFFRKLPDLQIRTRPRIMSQVALTPVYT